MFEHLFLVMEMFEHLFTGYLLLFSCLSG